MARKPKKYKGTGGGCQEACGMGSETDGVRGTGLTGVLA